MGASSEWLSHLAVWPDDPTSSGSIPGSAKNFQVRWVDLYRLRMLALLARNKDGDPRAASKSSSNGPTGLGVRNADTLKGVSGVETLKTRTETIIIKSGSFAATKGCLLLRRTPISSCILSRHSRPRALGPSLLHRRGPQGDGKNTASGPPSPTAPAVDAEMLCQPRRQQHGCNADRPRSCVSSTRCRA